MHIIGVFRSITDTYSFCNLLKSYGVNATVENTPRQAEVSCGLCVKFPCTAQKEATELIKRRKFASYVAFFSVQTFGNGISKIKKIVD